MDPRTMAWLLASGLFVLGCDGPEDDDTTDDDTADDGGSLVLTDAHTYSYEGNLVVDAVELAANADARVLWDGITVDIRGGAITGPEEIHEVGLVGFLMTQAEVIEAIATNDLLMSDVGDYRVFDNSDGASSAMLSQFEIIGNAFDPVADFGEPVGDWTWGVTLWSEMPDGRTDIRSVMFLVPTGGSDASEAAFANDTAVLDFLVDLHSAASLQTTSGLHYTVDWSGITADSFGHEIEPAASDRLLVGHAPGATVEQAETGFMAYFNQTETVYRLEVYGTTSADLAGATSISGAPFEGFTADGVWLVGLESLTSTSPAPLTMAVVEVSE